MLHDEYFQVTSDGLLVWDFTAWGWIWLLTGAVTALIGLGVMRGSAAARTAAVILTVAAMIGQIAYLAAFPLWSVIAIGIGVLVLYALMTPPDATWS